MASYLVYDVLNYTALKDLADAQCTGRKHVAYKTTRTDGLGGHFLWVSDDLTTEVAADPDEATYVVPYCKTATGEEGAFVRLSTHSATGGGGTSTQTTITVTNIAALKALTSASEAATYITQGYYSAADDGGGKYIYDADSTTTADDFLVIDPTTMAGRFFLLHNGTASVEQAGVTGGATAETAIINAAVQSAATEGIILVWRNKTYLMDGTLYPNNLFYWQCNDTTIQFDYSGNESNYHILRRRDNAYETLTGSDGNPVTMRVAFDLRNANTSKISGFLSLIGCQPGSFTLTARSNIPNWLVGMAASTNNMDPTQTNTVLATTKGYGAESEYDHIYFQGFACGGLYHQHSRPQATWAKNTAYLIYQCVTPPSPYTGTYQCLIAHTSNNTGTEAEAFATDLAAGNWTAFAGSTGRVLPWTRTRFREIETQFCLMPFRSGDSGTSFDDCVIDVMRITRCGGIRNTNSYGVGLISGTDMTIHSMFIYGLLQTSDYETITATSTAGSLTVTTSGDLTSLLAAGDTVVLGPASTSASPTTATGWPNRSYLQNIGCFFVSNITSLTDSTITFKDPVPYAVTGCKIYGIPLYLSLGGSIVNGHWFQEGLLDYVRVGATFTSGDFKISTGEYASQLDAGLIVSSIDAHVDITVNIDTRRSYFLKRIVGVVMQRDDDDIDTQPNVCVRLSDHLKPAWTYENAPYYNTQQGTIYYSLTKWSDNPAVAYTTADSVDYGGIEWKCASNHTSSTARTFWEDLAAGRWTRTGVPAAYGRQGTGYNRCLWLEYIYAPNSVRPEADRSTATLVPGGNVRMECGDGTFYLAPVIGQVLYQAYGPYGPRGSVSLLGGRIYSTYDQETIAGGGAIADIITAAELAGWKAAIFMARDGSSGSVTCYQTAFVQIASSSTAAAALNIHNLSTTTLNFEFLASGGILQLKNNNGSSRVAIINGLRIY